MSMALSAADKTKTTTKRGKEDAGKRRVEEEEGGDGGGWGGGGEVKKIFRLRELAIIIGNKLSRC